jgi:CheY-like chemotaxis protein
MAKSGPILIVEDDPDDQEIYKQIIKDIGVQNKIIFFSLASDGLKYLKETTEQPFVILCDINLPVINGIQFKQRIDSDPYLRRKSIPFIFFSTSAEKSQVHKGYTELTVQGFFKKEYSVEEMSKSLSVIFAYWELCKHPNSE